MSCRSVSHSVAHSTLTLCHSVSHSDYLSHTPSFCHYLIARWEIDLVFETTVYFFRVWRRADCCELPRNVKMSVISLSQGLRRSTAWEYTTTNEDRSRMITTFLELWPRTRGTAVRIGDCIADCYLEDMFIYDVCSTAMAVILAELI